jgi:glutathione S-transferase
MASLMVLRRALFGRVFSHTLHNLELRCSGAFPHFRCHSTSSPSTEPNALPTTSSPSTESNSLPSANSPSTESNTLPIKNSLSTESNDLPTISSPSTESNSLLTANSPSTESNSLLTANSPSTESNDLPSISSPSTESNTLPTISSPSTESNVLPTTNSPSTESTALSATSALFPGDELWDPSWNMGAGEETIRRRMNPTEEPLLQFYSSWFCPFAQQTWIALEESNVNYQWNEVRIIQFLKYVPFIVIKTNSFFPFFVLFQINPFQVDKLAPGGYTKKELYLKEKRKLYPDFMTVTPRGLVPALSHLAADGVTKQVLWDPLPTSEYVDAVFGTRSLMPSDPYERAKVQIWCDYCTNGIEQSFYKALLARNPRKRQGHLTYLFTKCRILARAMDATGPFFLGERFSMVDVVLAPFWQRMLWVGGQFMQLTFHEGSESDRLHTWWEATSKRPSIASTLVCQPRLVASYSEFDFKLPPLESQSSTSANAESASVEST